MKRIYTFIVGIVDVILLVIILKGIYSEKIKTENEAISETETAASYSETSTGFDSEVTRRTESYSLETEFEETFVNDFNENTPDISMNETTEEELTAESVQTEVPVQASETTVAQKAETSAPAARKTSGDQIPNMGSYSTNKYAEYADMTEAYLYTDSGFVWQELSENKVRIKELPSVLGGWKAWIVSNPSDIDHQVYDLTNINISGTENDLTVKLDWNYYYIIDSGDEGYSTENDSVYKGTWSDTGIYAEGPGSISFYEFEYDNGKEYGLGKVSYPDGSYGYIALVRP